MIKTMTALLGVCMLGLVALGFAMTQQEITFDQNASVEPTQPAASQPIPQYVVSATPADESNEIALLREEVSALKTLIHELASRPQSVVVSRPATNESGTQSPAIDSEMLQTAVSQAIGDALKHHEEWKAEEAKRKQEDAQREHQEMMKGPYGDQNYAVNYFGKQYGLNASQKDQYYTLLKWQAEEYNKVQVWYQEEWAVMQEQGVKTTGKEYKDLMSEYQQRYKDIQGRFDSDISRILTTEQYDNYKAGGAYPNWNGGGRKRAERS